MVSRISLKEAKELYALRGLLESYAAKQFTLLASDQEIEKLEMTVKALIVASKEEDKSDLLETKTDFYNILLDGCKNDLVKETLHGLLTRVNLLRSTSLLIPERLEKSLQEINQIVSSIKNRDPQGAEMHTKTHVINAEIAALGVLQLQQSITN